MNRKAARYRIGVDVGGTFTDAVAYDMADGSLRWAKAPSTPSEPALGVLDAVSALAGDLGAVERFVHGITIGTNAIIERKGADVWVVTTKGFRDTLEIQRTERRELYNIRTLKPPSFVPRPQVLEADERMRYDASVLQALDPAESERIAKTLGSAGAESVAVCFLHSFANDAHERAMRESLVAASPGAYVCTSSEVLPELREYERFSTTVLNAYIGPLMSRYLQALESHLASRGFARTIFLMTSNGGVVSAERARRLPVQTVLSGPAGGVAASVELGRRIDVENLITYDMGGTSTDVCLVEGLRAPLTTEQMIAGYPNRTPQVEIVTIGAGGGSIAWLDGGETLAVGPRSAGADPGPAAYGRGGTDPTVTDANLVLGRLGSETKLASTLALDGTLARASLDRLAAAFGGIETHVLADGVIRIAVARMVSAIKEISIAKGYDPRDFVLLAYGGAGPMHGALVASELDIDHVVVPPSPGNFSAFGCLVSDLQITRTRTLLVETRRGEWPTVADALGGLEHEGGAELEREGVETSEIVFRRELGMRYVGQSWELVVPIAPDVDSLRDVEIAFHAAHAKRYGHGTDAPAEIVTVRVTAIARTGKPALRNPAHEGTDAGARMRPVFIDGTWSETAVLVRTALSAGAAVEGPALVEEMGSVTVVPPDWRLEVGAIGEFHLRREGSRESAA
ncbi:MAG: hydantoinase/oxoprolinase family protein [Thiotrichales bacterium]|nr:hydantoinase/oxoprolinase family protein [Thiotrichales bacterium]